MQYCLFMHHREAAEAGVTEEQMTLGRAAFATYAGDLDAAGVLIGAQVLQPAAASRTLTADAVRDGVFAATTERLAGVFVIEVADPDAALSWARRCPAAAWGSIEVRPVAVTYARGTGWYQP